jgi:glycosyltransferase involved in cell wall biosynthesis
MMRASKHVVTISEASKKDLVEKFKVPADHVSVIYPGFKLLLNSSIASLEMNHAPYFMYIGPMKERKNVLTIVEAFILFRRLTGLAHELILVGRQSGGAYEEKVLTRISESEYKDSIVCKTSVTDGELHDVYEHAEALVFPSLLEGFGLPVLEAFSVGTMVITSKTTSTAEAAGEAGILVNPESVPEIASALAKVARGDFDMEQFAKEATLQVAKFSWGRSGREWNELFHSCIVGDNTNVYEK